jgi:hypothetical protein
MAYNAALLSLVSQGIGGVGKTFHYTSTEAGTVLDGSGYVSNATQAGMSVGDLVLVVDSDATNATITAHSVSAITSGAGNLSDGTTIGSATIGD